MASKVIDDQWEFMLQHPDHHVRRIAERASREPLLRRLFPYTSMSNLRFSTTSEYPVAGLPYVLKVTSGGGYEARDADNRPLAEGDLKVVIPAVVEAIRGSGGA